MQPVVELRDISKVFGSKTVIDEVNLVIPEKSFVTFLGPSGCGKTTLLRMIAGFYEPDAGEILIKGRRVDRVPPYGRNTAMVFQEYALFPHLTVFKNVAYGLEVQKMPKGEIRQKVAEALAMMQLTGLEDRYPNQMSGGQQQRVAVARALVMNPDALLLDEPLSNLDAKLREDVRLELRLIQKQLELTAIYVTHDQQEALSMSDMVVVMDKGKIQQTGHPRDIYFRPASRFVADFIGTTNLVDIDAASGRPLYMDSVLPVAIPTGASRISASIRPESIRLEDAPCEGCFVLPVKIRYSQFLGEKIRYIAEDADGKDWIVDKYDPGDTDKTGETYLIVPPPAIHVIEGSD